MARRFYYGREVRSVSYPWRNNTYLIRDWTVIDGDTIHAHDVDLGLATHRAVKIRLNGFDSPELRRGTEEEKERGRLARAALASLLNRGDVLARFRKGRSFDRWIADLYVSIDGEEVSVREWMIAKGHVT